MVFLLILLPLAVLLCLELIPLLYVLILESLKIHGALPGHKHRVLSRGVSSGYWCFLSCPLSV